MTAIAVAHALPGRVRLRVPPRTDGEALAGTVSALEGVIACQWSPRTCGLLVSYDHHATDLATILEHVADETGLESPAVDDAGRLSAVNGGSPSPALAVPTLFRQANQRVADATRGTLDLASGIPLALVVWAAIELWRGRAAPLAWSSALWYAHGLFRDYNLPSNQS